MEALLKKIEIFQKVINDACQRVKLNELEAELKKVSETTRQTDFWQDAQKAGIVMKQQSSLENRVQP